MKQSPPPAHEEHDLPEPTSGKDEMNLAEFPFASLTRVPDKKALVYEGSVTDRDGVRHQQRWVVSGSITTGLPTEFDERVMVALLAATASQGFSSPRVPISVYQLIKVMGLARSQRTYQDIEAALKRLVAVTIFSEGAFWDHDQKERVTTAEAFHLIDRYWLRYREKNEKIREEEGVPGYIVWGDVLWRSFLANYIKPLDLRFFYSLQSPLARRLYRFLDKRMQYQDTYEIDIYDLAARLGMAYYAKPVWVRRKLQPALDELIGKGFLLAAEPVKRKGYTRLRFTKAPGHMLRDATAALEEPDSEDDAGDAGYRALAMQERYGVSEELRAIWAEALGQMAGAMTKSAFHTWLTDTYLLALTDGAARIGVPSAPVAEWLQHRLSPILIRALADASGQPVAQLSFQVLTLEEA